MVVQLGLVNPEPVRLPLPFPPRPFTLPANVTTVPYVFAGTFPPELEGIDGVIAVPTGKTLVVGLYEMLGACAPALIDTTINNSAINECFGCFFTTIN